MAPAAMVQCGHRARDGLGCGTREHAEESATANHQRMSAPTTNGGRERAFLAAVESDRDEPLWSADDSVAELASLARTAGAEVVGSLVQRLRTPDPATYLGKGRA